MCETTYTKRSCKAYIQPSLIENGKCGPFSNFFFGSACSTLEELQEYVSFLGDTNSERKDNACKLTKKHEIITQLGLYSWGKPAEYIFMLCEYWGLQDEAKYTALELFNVFMSSLINQLEKLVYGHTASHCQSDSSFDTTSEINNHHTRRFAPGEVFSSSDKTLHSNWGNVEYNKLDKEWTKTLQHIKDQMRLRAVTCVIIASKLTTHYEVVTMNKALDLLRKQGQHFSKSVLIKSELRILNAVNFQINSLPSPHPYITVMLEILGKSDAYIGVKRFYSVCIRILDLFYYFRPIIIGRVCRISTAKSGLPVIWSPGDAHLFFETMNDLQLISAAVIASSVYVKDKCLSDRIITLLSKMINVPECSVTHFAFIILDVILTC